MLTRPNEIQDLSSVLTQGGSAGNQVISDVGGLGINTVPAVGVALDVNGAVKIGQVSIPAQNNYSLYVEKGILTERVKIAIKTDAAWSDYVFEEDYPLKSLSEVEAFVTQNKHLPGIPSAKEVVEEGIDVAKMDAKLLEKIEELTLYIIDMNKRMNRLEQENKALKKNFKK